MICYFKLLVYLVRISAAESQREPGKESWFIEELCYQLDNRTNNCRDLLELLTKVIDNVVNRQQEYTNKNNRTEYFAQTPEIVSFLHRSVILP